MKSKTLSTIRAVALGGLGLFTAYPSAIAIERPGGRDADPGVEIVPEKAEDQVQKRAFLGVMTQPADELLLSHLKLEGGAVIRAVSPGSPAEGAGLAPMDIITAIDGEAVSDPFVLRQVVRAQAGGSEVKVGIIRAGDPLEIAVELGEIADRQVFDRFRRPAGPRVDPRLGGIDMDAQLKLLRDLVDRQQLRGGQLGLQPFMLDLPGGGDLDRQMEELREQLKAMGMGDLDLPQVNGLHATKSMIFTDDQGSIRVTEVNGQIDVVVTGNDGEEVFRGPYTTPADRASVPQAVFERLEKLPIPPAQAVEDDAPEDDDGVIDLE